MKNILVHGNAEPVQLERLAALSVGDIIYMKAAWEEQGWVVADNQKQNVCVMLTTFPPANLVDLGNLELIQIGSAGYSQLVGLDLPAQGIRACNALEAV